MTTLDRFRLDGRVALVTGASSGLGVAIAQCLAEAGADVVLGARRLDKLEKTRALVEESGRAAIAVQTDVADPDSCSAMVAAAVGAFGRVDVLVNNAGISWGAPVEAMRLEDWGKVVETNLTGTFLCSQAAGRVMIDQKKGSIVNIASVSGLGGAPPDLLRAAGYHASKGGVIAFTRDLACEWARHGIRVNAIAPGWFPTHMSRPVLGRSADRLREGIPLGRFGTRDDLKGAVAFLASDASAYVTGHVLVVDGGQSAW